MLNSDRLRFLNEVFILYIMNYFENKKNVNLLTWETVEKKRNVNNVITFYVNKGIDVNVSDVIIGNYNTDFFSGYQIDEILEIRDGNISTENHITARTNWKWHPLTDLKHINQEYLGFGIIKAIK